VVFKLSPGGTETVLHSFCGGPHASLIADSSGNLYGTTQQGGVVCELPVVASCGVVFKLSPGGTETVLHSFTGSPGDGAIPAGGPLIADSSGNLYGTTQYGGAAGGDSSGACCGVVFKLTGTGFAPPPAYVTNTGSNTVSVLDTVTNAVLATVPVGVKPEGVAVTPDGTQAYVANAGSNTVSVIATATNTVAATVPVIATATNTVAATVPVGLKPKGVAVNPTGLHAYVTNSTDGTVSVIKTSTNTVVATVLVEDTPM
jgi:YVTN family beta-propeller protein/uncharacterized repeat protein (TIGR03803 family)